MIGQAEAQISSVASFSSDLKEISGLLGGISADLQELNDRIRTVTEKTDFQPGEVDQVISRLDLIDSLKSKYGRSIEEILSYRDRIAGELEMVENFEEQKADLEKAPAITASGGDSCEFLISTNKGEPLKSLARTASGGEISRIMLAIKNVIGDDDQIPTMIFDEIDTGISGITASVVARKLQQIAKNHQIICITHLPQIAAAADTNYDATYSHIQLLDAEQKTAEIARLLGGDAVTDLTMKSAEQLISAMEKHD